MPWLQVRLSLKAKLLVYQFTMFQPSLIIMSFGQLLKVGMQEQTAEVSWLSIVTGLSLRDTLKSSFIWRGLRVKWLLLLVKRSQLRWFEI